MSIYAHIFELLLVAIMKHDLLIYILKLEYLPFIKLGKSENLRIRIKQIVKEYECLIDYNESYVIKASATYIKHQERQLLNDIPFDLTDEEYEPFENSTGSTELRKESNLEKIIEYFNLKKSLFKLDIDIIKGINFSGFYSPRIPERLSYREEGYSIIEGTRRTGSENSTGERCR